MSDARDSAAAKLTDRQRECLRLLGQNFRIKEIAIRLGNSPETVKQHLAAARKLFDVQTSIEAARAFLAYEQSIGHLSTWQGIPGFLPEALDEVPPPKGVNPSLPLAPTRIDDAPIGSSREWRRWLGPLGWLIPAHRGATNDLSLVQRVILLIILPMVILMISVGALASYETLLRLLARA